jgi:hypothetical protein
MSKIKVWADTLAWAGMAFVMITLTVLGIAGAVYNWNNPEYWEPVEDFWTLSTATPAPTATQEVLRIELIIMTPTATRGD